MEEANAKGSDKVGIRKIAYQPKDDIKCIIHPDLTELADGSQISTYKVKKSGKDYFYLNDIKYIYQDTEIEECSIYDDYVKNSPFVKFISMLIAVVIALLGLAALIICCSYCNLEQKYNKLSAELTQSTREVGLPEEYEY